MVLTLMSIYIFQWRSWWDGIIQWGNIRGEVRIKWFGLKPHSPNSCHDDDFMIMIIWFGVLAWWGVLVFGPSVNDHRLRKHLRKTACFSCDTYLVINEKVATVEWRGITTPWPWWPPHGHLMVGGQKRTLSNKVHECRTHRLFLEFNVLTHALGGVAVASTDN